MTNGKNFFDKTPNGTIRVFHYFDKEINETKETFSETLLYSFFEFCSVWDGPDKVTDEYISWELPLEMQDFLEYKFKYNGKASFGWKTKHNFLD